MPLTFQREAYRACEPELQAIYPEHWRELAFDQDIIALDPDYERYHALDDAGMLTLVTARSGEKLVGYFIFFVMRALHYRQSMQGFYDIFYLRKPWRKGRNGIEFIKAAEAVLREQGVQKVYTGVKLPHDFGLVFERLGYRPTERIYTKILGD